MLLEYLKFYKSMLGSLIVHELLNKKLILPPSVFLMCWICQDCTNDLKVTVTLPSQKIRKQVAIGKLECLKVKQDQIVIAHHKIWPFNRTFVNSAGPANPYPLFQNQINILSQIIPLTILINLDLGSPCSALQKRHLTQIVQIKSWNVWTPANKFPFYQNRHFDATRPHSRLP